MRQITGPTVYIGLLAGSEPAVQDLLGKVIVLNRCFASHKQQSLPNKKTPNCYGINVYITQL